MRLRMAVAPGALLQLGQARLALLTWLTARRHASEVTLRLDDADPAQLREDHRETVPHDLRWLGLDWDACVLQSGRLDAYAAAADRLRAAGRLYPCFESEEELTFKRELRQRQGKPTIYDRAMLKMTAAQRARAEANGKQPYWRFLLGGAAEWGDMVLGRQQVKLSAISDPVVIRADGTPLPLFTGVVDDVETRVTHVLRDADQVTQTALQHDMRAALGARADSVRYGHLPGIVMEAHGRRAHVPSIRSLRTDGLEPAALVGVLAAMGTGARPQAAEAAALAPAFDLTRVGRKAPRFDAAELLATNRAALAAMPFEAVRERLPAGATAAFWTGVRGGVDLLREARAWWEVVAGTIVPPLLDGEGAALRLAMRLLPEEPWQDGIWGVWVAAVAGATGRPDAEVATVLRLVLTGEEDGPALDGLLPLVGRTRAMTRLEQAAGPLPEGSFEGSPAVAV